MLSRVPGFRRLPFSALALLLAIVQLVSVVPGTVHALPSSDQRSAANSALATRILRGAYIPGAPHDAAALTSFNDLTGTVPDIVQWYQPWGRDWSGSASSDIDLSDLTRVAALGASPMITWEPWGPTPEGDPSSVSRITSGAFDTYIDEWAQRLKTYAQPVYLRPFHEMNNPAYAWAYGQNGNSAVDLINAWRHVHERFGRAGATNVRWVWCPNTETDSVSFDSLYPGDAYVDWLGVDGYNGGTQLTWGGWLSPEQLFTRSYRSLVRLSPSKPIMIAETSTVEQGGSKPGWIDDLFTSLPRAFPNVRAIIWFDADDSSRGEADWRINTSTSALAAYRSSSGM